MKLPKQTEGIPVFKITWQYSDDNGTTWFPAGESRNHLYLTYEPMSLQGATFVKRNLQTVFAYAASDSQSFDDSKGDPKDLLNNIIWANFSPPNARRALDNQKLTYYHDWTTMNLTYWALVSKFDGQCSAWATLLAAAMFADGLDTIKNWTMQYDLIVPKEAVMTKNYQKYGLLVNYWSFKNNPGLNVNYYLGKDQHNYIWNVSEPVQAIYKLGVKGQNEPYPASAFNNHQIIEVHRGVNDVLLLDPSYGTSYVPKNGFTALEKFQNLAIAGFYSNDGPQPGIKGDKISIQLNNPRDPLKLQTLAVAWVNVWSLLSSTGP
jgi:hypothetical protein